MDTEKLSLCELFGTTFCALSGIWVTTPYLPIMHTKDNWYVVSGVNVRSKFVNKTHEHQARRIRGS